VPPARALPGSEHTGSRPIWCNLIESRTDKPRPFREKALSCPYVLGGDRRVGPVEARRERPEGVDHRKWDCHEIKGELGRLAGARFVAPPVASAVVLDGVRKERSLGTVPEPAESSKQGIGYASSASRGEISLAECHGRCATLTDLDTSGSGTPDGEAKNGCSF